MKNKDIEMPDDLDVCDSCGEEVPVQELQKFTERNGVVKQYCKDCLELIEQEDLN